MEPWIIYYYIIGFIFIFLIVIRIFLASYNDSVNIKSKSIQELNTGDLLFVKYDNSLGYFMRFWSNSPWTHTAMVYRAPDDNLYVMETANYRKSKGVLFMPIQKWIKLNQKCEISVMHLSTPESYDRNLILKSFEKIKNKKLDTFNINWLRLLRKTPYQNLKNNENITCYEMIVYLLQDGGIAQKEFSPSSYFPTNIIQNQLNLNNGFEFSNLKTFFKENHLNFKNDRFFN